MTHKNMLNYTHKEMIMVYKQLGTLIAEVEAYLQENETHIEKESEEITHSSQYNPLNPPGICVIKEPVSEIFTRLVGILYDVSGCDIAKITPNVTMKELDLDILDIYEFVMAVEEEYGIKISEDEECQFIYYPLSKIVKYIEGLVEESNKPIYKSLSPSYIEGWNFGYANGINKNPIYLPNDDKGADSPEQAEYMRGYVDGYQSTTSS